MIDKFAETVVREIRRQMNNLADSLANGNARTMEEYRHTCGFIRGLAAAEEYIKDLAKEQEETE